MFADLVLSFSKDKALFLIKQQELQHIDRVTSQYADFHNFYLMGSFKAEIDAFHLRYQDYRRKIVNPSDRSGKLRLQMVNQGKIISLDVFYSSLINCIDNKILLNRIKMSLKKEKSSKLILQIYREYDFFLGSDYNYQNHLRFLLKKMRTYDLSEQTKKDYYKLIKMIIDTIVIANDSYYYARILYDFILQQKKKESFSISHSVSSPYSNSSFSSFDLKPKQEKRIEAYHGMGDHFLREDYDREYVYRK